MGLLFTLSLTYGGAITSLFRPYYGFLIYVCFAIVRPPALWHWSVPASGNYSRIIGIALLLGWALHGFGNWKFGGSRTILICLLGFWAWMILSTALSPPPVNGWPTVEHYAKIVLPFLAGLTLIKTEADVWKLAWVIMLSTGFVAYEYNLHYYNGGDADKFLRQDGNTLSIAMLPGCGLAFFCGLLKQKGWRRWLLFLIAALIAHIPMASMSRGGMLGLVCLGVTSFILIPKKPRFLAFYGLAVAAGLFLAGPSVVEEFNTVFTDTKELEDQDYGRMFIWKACFNEMLRKPVFGCGQDRWPFTAASYGFATENKDAHSLWAQTGAELGVPGISLLLGFYLSTIWLQWRQASRETNVELAILSKMVILGLIGFMVPASFVTVEGFEIPYYVALVGAATIKLADFAPAPVRNHPIPGHRVRSPDYSFQGQRTAGGPLA